MNDYLPLLQSFDFPISTSMNIINSINFLEFRLQTSFWTSGSSGGLICGAERTFVWCSTGNIADETIITDSQLRNYSGYSGNESTANCVTLGLNQGRAQLSLAACSEAKPFMCQVRRGKNANKVFLNHSFLCSPNARLQLALATA